MGLAKLETNFTCVFKVSELLESRMRNFENTHGNILYVLSPMTLQTDQSKALSGNARKSFKTKLICAFNACNLLTRKYTRKREKCRQKLTDKRLCTDGN